LFTTIRDTCARFNLATTPRVAGGWVRDKLLGRQSADIDIAVDDCSGEEFANRVNAHLVCEGMETHTVGIIKANPDQSKHLATAAARVHGMHVDFVQLRGDEWYSADSRIPDVSSGTPASDAARRDFTVNALFFNIRTAVVEDYTGQGLADLAAGLLRTPLPASATFADDPLRMLRGIRFAARFGFALDEQVCAALSDPANAALLRSKVSNERVGQELLRCLEGERPECAVDLLLAHGLADAVFKIPSSTGAGAGLGAATGAAAVDWAEGGRMANAMLRFARAESLERAPSALAALLLPLAGRECAVPGKKDRRDDAVLVVVTHYLKLSHRIAESASRIVRGASRFAALLSAGAPDDDDDDDDAQRVAVGRIIHAVEDAWLPALELAIVSDEPGRRQAGDAMRELVRGRWALHDVHERLKSRPVLDGRAVMALLAVKGPAVSAAMELLRDFCYGHPAPAASSGPEWDAYVASAKAFLVARWRRR